MSSSRRRLHLHEQLLLPVLRDRKGTVDYRAGHYNYALGGAILAELAVEGRIAIDEDRKALVHPVAGAPPTGDEILDEALGQVRERRRPRRAGAWVQRFSALRKLRERTARGLCRRGILRATDAQLLLIFSRKVYPTVDPRPERELVASLREAITGDDDVEVGVAVVLLLAHATGSLRIHFSGKELRPHKARLKRIGAGEHLAGPVLPAVRAHMAVKSAVAAAQAVVAASTVATTASS